MKTLPVVLGILCGFSSPTSAADTPKQPNIVVIITDDQGCADISFNPHHPKEVLTTHLDALAREGVFFTQAYTSGPVCSPTRAGLMLGCYRRCSGWYSVRGWAQAYFHARPLLSAPLSGTIYYCSLHSGNREGRMRETKKSESWVVYKMTLWGKLPGPNAVCEQGEWDEMERAQPGYHALIRGGVANEGEAERLARESPGGTSDRVASRFKAR